MKYIILTCSIFIMSCSVQKNILSDFNSEGFNITNLKGSSIRLYVNPVIDIGEFGKSFENEYTSNSLFCSILTDKLKEKLNRFSMIYVDPNVNMDTLFLNQSISDNNNRVKGIFEHVNENYLLGIKRVVVAKSVDQNPQTPIANTPVSSSRNRMTVSSSSNEVKKTDACVIKMVAEVWSVKEKKKVAEFTSIGQSKIFLRMYGRALNEALDYSVSNLASYIEEKKE
jgi:hypothetical protein